MKSVYKLEYRFTVTRYEVEDSDPKYPRYTNDHLTIEDTFDLADPMTLTQALATIDDIHHQLTAGRRART